MQINDDNWYAWYNPYGWKVDPFYVPYSFAKIELAREEWDASIIVDPNKLDPAMNVFNLYWRPYEL